MICPQPAGGEMSEPEHAPPGVDPTRPSPARMYDYYLGGKHNLAVDREFGDRMIAAAPDLPDGVWANRAFHQRAAAWLAAHAGIRQFIDLGSGLPTQSNTHHAVHKVAPAARVVYVDHDPMVAAYAAELLTDDGTTAVITADLREPDAILAAPAVAALIDLTQPVGLLMTAVLHFVADGSDPWGLVARYVAATAPGSYLVLSHFTMDKMPPRAVQASKDIYAQGTAGIFPRSRPQIARFFDGLEFVPAQEGGEPDLTFVGSWRADDPEAADSDGSRGLLCGVARRR
jgi:S-adenosyl methyltransferase